MEELRKVLTIVLLTGIFIPLILISSPVNAAPVGMDIVWNPPLNISNSPGNTSTDPFLLADPTGKVHLFWGEKVSTLPGAQADTLMYTVWDGNNWFKPIDIFFAPESDGNPVINYPHAVMDNDGFIHLIWLQQPNFPNYTLYYSTAFAPDALLADSWTPEEAIATDLSGTKYSVDIAFRSNQELHILYARGQQGEGVKEERSVAYLRSLDGGLSWSDPVDIAIIKNIQNGASDTKILLDGEERIYATWTEWDKDGLGHAVYFARSLDNGETWENPIAITTTQGNEYERDWSNIEILGPDQLVIIWEGGWRAYRNAQYSEDGGATWSRPIDTFPWLIGENGTVEFARDSNNTLHLFVAQRVREGYFAYGDGTNPFVWHSVWEGGQKWSEPVAIPSTDRLVNPKAAITGGNQIALTWYNPNDLEILVMTGQIQGAPRTLLPSWIKPAALAPTITPTPVIEPTVDTSGILEPTPFSETTSSNEPARFNISQILPVGVILIIFVIGFVIIFVRRSR